MTLLTLIPLLLAAAPPDRPIRPLPSMSREPKLDGVLKDFKPAADLKMPRSAKGPSASVALKAAWRKDTLYVAAAVKDDTVLPSDELSLSLYFPGAGLTARGFVYRFNSEGPGTPHPELAPPDWAQARLKSGTAVTAKGWTVEIAIPASALPRFQAQTQLALSICAEYADQDDEGGAATTLSTCPKNEMEGGPTRLPDELRKVLKAAPPADVEGIEPREVGYVGYSILHYPLWAVTSDKMTPELMLELIGGDDAVEPATVALPIPKELQLSDNSPVYTVLTGKNPYVGDTCKPENELRLALYVVKGFQANRVLEWPAATCKLGRAMRFEMNDGMLTIGYTNGSTSHFVWTADHFERSELGLAQ